MNTKNRRNETNSAKLLNLEFKRRDLRLQVWSIRLVVVGFVVSTIITPLLKPAAEAIGELIRTEIFCKRLKVIALASCGLVTDHRNSVTPSLPPLQDCNISQNTPPCRYTIKTGDTLSSISRSFYQTEKYWPRLCEANHSLLQSRFNNLTKELKAKLASPCHYIDAGWELIVPAL